MQPHSTTSSAPEVKSPEERFWERVDKDGPIPPHMPHLGPCWLWTSNLMGRGYGNHYAPELHGKIGAHRYSWMLTHGPIPDGLCVLHHCDNMRCVNPTHLWLGTNADNQRDMRAKGRDYRLPPPSPELRAKVAEANRRRVVTEESKAKWRAANKNRTHSAETRAKISAANKGRRPSEAARQKMRLAAKNRRPPISEDTRAKHRALMLAQWAKRRHDAATAL